MKKLNFVVQALVGVGLIVWGCEFLPGVITKPQILHNWAGVVLILAGILIAARICYVERSGGLLVGIPLLGFASLWAWNLHYYFDASRVKGGKGPPASFYASPTLLILLGVVFAVFFRYLYPTKPPMAVPGVVDTGTAAKPATKGLRAEPGSDQRRPWHRLAMVAASALLGIIVSTLSRVQDSEARTKVMLTVMILGCVATGIISEKTLVKIFPWKSQ